MKQRDVGSNKRGFGPVGRSPTSVGRPVRLLRPDRLPQFVTVETDQVGDGAEIWKPNESGKGEGTT